MPAPLRRLLERFKQKADRSAAGTAVPAGLDPNERPGPTARERTTMRRRLRALRRRREALLQDGAKPELEELDAEARTLNEALRKRKTLDELLSTGRWTLCSSCGELVAKRERTCPNCGAQTGPPGQAEPHPPAGRSAHAPSQATVITGASSGRSPSPPAH